MKTILDVGVEVKKVEDEEFWTWSQNTEESPILNFMEPRKTWKSLNGILMGIGIAINFVTQQMGRIVYKISRILTTVCAITLPFEAWKVIFHYHLSLFSRAQT